MKKLAFLGGGKMAEAIIKGLLAAGWAAAEEMVVSDIDRSRLEALAREYRVNTSVSNREAASEAEVVLLAVKPQNVEEVMEEVAETLRPGQVLISIAMGKSTAFLESLATGETAVVRVMPNNPAMVGRAVSVISYGRFADDRARESALGIFRCLGEVLEIEERHQDAAMAISGCGPAYFYLIAEAIADAGVKLGLQRDLALRLAVGTMFGAASMMRESGLEPARLRGMVASPAGSTIMALEALEESGIRAAFFRALEAAYRRAREV
jgi:pyrroline-5-carboxylate reductase